MDVVLLVVLLGLGALGSSEGQAEIAESFRTGAQLALQHVHSHSGIQNHFRFFKTVSSSDVDAGFGVKFLYLHFFLKATRCRRGTAEPDETKCPFRNDRPLIDCGMCFKTFNGQIEEEPNPFIHCVHKPTLTKDMVFKRMDVCNKMSYSSGSASVLLVRQE